MNHSLLHRYFFFGPHVSEKTFPREKIHFSATPVDNPIIQQKTNPVIDFCQIGD